MKRCEKESKRKPAVKSIAFNCGLLGKCRSPTAPDTRKRKVVKKKEKEADRPRGNGGTSGHMRSLQGETARRIVSANVVEDDGHEGSKTADYSISSTSGSVDAGESRRGKSK